MIYGRILILICFALYAGVFSAYCADATKRIPDKAFVAKTAQSIHKLSRKQLERIKHTLLNSPDADPVEFIMEFLNSGNSKTEKFGMELMTAVCIECPESFRPHEFFKEYAKRGTRSSPYLSEIIAKTEDDFCREWACELAVELYFHNISHTDPRYEKLKEYKKAEQKIYDFCSELLSNDKLMKKMADKGENPADYIVKQWGTKRRYTMKMLALIANFDLMDKKNYKVCAKRAGNIINKYNFNYNILGHLNGSPLDRPPVPLSLKMKILADSILKDGITTTEQWANGNKDDIFSKDDLEAAVELRDTRKMKKYYSILKRIVTDVLKSKILIGLGNNELELLRYFYFAVWQNEPMRWSFRTVTIRNRTGKDGDFYLYANHNFDKPYKTHVPARGTFIWFLPPGLYTLSVMPGSRLNLNKVSEKINISDKNAEIIINQELVR